MTQFSLTLWDNLYDIDRYTPWSGSWEDLVKRFGTHLPTPKKNQAPGFGPYSLQPSPVPCYKHTDGVPRSSPHRCDASVHEMSVLVFDVDQGTQEQVAACDDRLAAAGLARLWYSTFSFGTPRPPDGPVRVPFRLIVPLAAPLHPAHYARVRTVFLARFDIPADEKQCSGKSHFYFMPSTPLRPKHQPVVDWSDGAYFDASSLVVNRPEPAPARQVELPANWAPRRRPRATPTTDDGIVADYRTRLERKFDNLARRRGDETKADYLRRCLDGRVLAQSGSRNTAALVTSGVLVFALPDASVEDIQEILRPSLEAMQQAGSKLTAETLERMIVDSQRDLALLEACQLQEDRTQAEKQQRLRAEREAAVADIRARSPSAAAGTTRAP